MSNFNFKSFARSPIEGTDKPSETEIVDETSEPVDENPEAADDKSTLLLESERKKAKIAIDYALTAINQGNNSKWTISSSGLANPRSYVGLSSVSGRAKASAGSTLERGEGAIKFLQKLLGEANAVDKKFNPLFSMVKGISSKDDVSKEFETSPPQEWVDEILEGWEKVNDYRSWYGERSAYNFIVGKSDSLLDKFKLAWTNVDRFRETNLLEDIFDLFSASTGSLDTSPSNIMDFLQSILLWRATIVAIRKVVSGSNISEGAETVEKDDPSDVADDEKVPDEVSIDNLNVTLELIRSGSDAASVDRITSNVMIDRGVVASGKDVVIIFHFYGVDARNLANMNSDSLMPFLMQYIELDEKLADEKVGSVVGVEHKEKKAKIYLKIDENFIRRITAESENTVEVFKINIGDKYLKVEASDLDRYNEIRKIAYSTSTSYYTVTTPSGKKVDLSIADMVMGKGYVSGPGNKFKAKSLSGRVLKKKKLKK